MVEDDVFDRDLEQNQTLIGIMEVPLGANDQDNVIRFDDSMEEL